MSVTSRQRKRLDVVLAVARALLQTSPHHAWTMNSPSCDGPTSLDLDGRGEFHDHHWEIASDGTLSQREALPIGSDEWFALDPHDLNGGAEVHRHRWTGHAPPPILGSSDNPAEALLAFISHELEHWGFTVTPVDGIASTTIVSVGASSDYYLEVTPRDGSRPEC